MRRYLFRRWVGLPKTRTFTAAEVEQNHTVVQGYLNQRFEVGPAPIMEWITLVDRHNPGRNLRDVVEHQSDGSVTVTVRRP